jgi:FkbH-like protein
LSLSRHTSYALDYQRLLKVAKRQNLPNSAAVIRLALLADCATQQLALLLKALLGEAGLRAEIYQGAFDAIEIESCAPDSSLYQFRPDAVIILNCAQALRAAYATQLHEHDAFAAQRLERILRTWDAIEARSPATIVQSTFASPPDSYYGNFELKVAQSLRSTVATLNAGIVAAARERARVRIHDVDNVASWVGRRQFFDERLWDLWKTPCSLEHLPRIAGNIADILLALRGEVVKCVVTDLDNTLWGGVIGDDGLEGIVLNAHGGGAGESFVRLQQFLKQLQDRGIVLAVCSKNEEQAALAPFLQHPDMVLKRQDIAVFVANWDDKATGIRRIGDTLNIGLNSIVFLDDNPFERNLVRQMLPEVIVPELPEDPANFVSYLSELNLFETAYLSSEDRQRAAQYRHEAKRRAAAAEFISLEDYLRSLDMRASVARFDALHLPRIAQLMQRSNQFNLCTRRLTEVQCAALAQDPTYVPLYAKLADRFGDHGLICVIVLECTADALVIRDWLMSCRVLTRGVEQLLMNYVFARAAQLRVRRVMGEYIPTPKNALVRDFFPQSGFARVTPTGNQWTLDVTAYRPRDTFIRLVDAQSLQQNAEVS